MTSTTVGGGLDSDGDGMPDIWETAMGLNPFFYDANDDYDGDGSSNWQEYLAGTRPLDPASCLKIVASTSTNGIRLTFQAVAGRSYTIQYHEALAGSQWNKLTNIAPQMTDRSVEIPDPLSAAAGERFYRLTTPQVP